MNRVIDSLVLLSLSTAVLFQDKGQTESVLIFLIAFITVALGIYIEKEKQFGVVEVCFCVLCFLLPALTFFSPILFYYVYSYRNPWMTIAMLPSLGVFLQTGVGGKEMFLWLVLNVLSCLLSKRAEQIERQKQELIRMRDSDTELNLVLREKNKNLREKQDYEIYLATLRERNRIAREIHDNVGHMLSRSILQIGALQAIYKEEPLYGQLGSVNDTLNHAMNSIRDSVHDLHDDAVDLRQAVDEVTREMQGRYQIRIEYDMSKAVPRNVKYCFITTIKEAMSNVVRHSDAQRIEIVLREHPGFYQLFIGDNGSPRESRAEDGIGLQNMRERVAALNGTIHISAEQGFKIFISVKKDSLGGQVHESTCGR